MSTFINSPTLDQLQQKYQDTVKKAANYKRANLILDYPRDADITYLKLVRDKILAFMEYRKMENEDEYNRLFKQVYTRKLADVEELLRERGVNL